MADLQIPEFFSTNAFELRDEMITFYETLTNRKLQPAEVEILLFGAFAYRETVLRSDANNAALQNLAAFSSFPVLDYLAQNVGIRQRNPAQAAKTTIAFALNIHPNLVIQRGTRISHPDGQPVFAVMEDTLVLASGTAHDVEIQCESIEPGTLANGFAIGSITTLIDTFSYFASCSNTTITAGGSEEESDTQLRERIYLAPDAFSACGPISAYKFHALSAHPTIIDVSVEGPVAGKAYPPAGTVAIYPLTTTVPTPQVVLDAVKAACSGEKKVPTTDTVVVAAPTAVNYTIVGSLTLYNGADDGLVIGEINDLLETYKKEKGSKLGQDIVRNQIIKLCMVPGVYEFNLTSIPSNITIGPSQFGNCTLIDIDNITGYTHG